MNVNNLQNIVAIYSYSDSDLFRSMFCIYSLLLINVISKMYYHSILKLFIRHRMYELLHFFLNNKSDLQLHTNISDSFPLIIIVSIPSNYFSQANFVL